MTGPDTPTSAWGFPEVQSFDESPREPAQEQSFQEPSVEPAPALYVPRRLAVESPPVSPMRALAGALVAVAGVLLGIGALLWATDAPGGSPTVSTGQTQTTPVAPQTSAPPSTPLVVPATPAPLVTAVSPPPSPAPVPKLAITVLNNSRITGLADRAAERFRAGGWPIRDTGNFTGKVTDTTVYYAPGQVASARLLQQSFSGLVRVRPRFAALPGSGLTVVLTRDYRR